MSELNDILKRAKYQVENFDYTNAVSTIEKLLLLLKNDYDAGINKEKSGKAYNKLILVRKELISKKLTDLTYNTLHISKSNKEVDKKDSKTTNSLVDFNENNISRSNKNVIEKEESKKDEGEKILKDFASDNEKEIEPEKIENENENIISSEFQFKWDDIPSVKFEDIAGLENVKELVEVKVLLPLLHPEAAVGYVSKGGGGLCLYGPPGTGKTMMAAAIANKINANFCSIVPSDLLRSGVGNTEKAIKALFQQARQYKCAVIYFDEMDALTSKSTKSQVTKNLRSEFLAQLQGISSYGQKSDNILFLICATNKPWEIDSAFLRPGRFGTKIYVGLPDYSAIKYILDHHIDKIKKAGIVKIKDDIDTDFYAKKLKGYNCSDISNILTNVEELSMRRYIKTGEKCICNNDFVLAIEQSTSSVQNEDLVKLEEWKKINDTSSIKLSEQSN